MEINIFVISEVIQTSKVFSSESDATGKANFINQRHVSTEQSFIDKVSYD